MDEHKIPNRISETKVSGRRPWGKPHTWWLDQVIRYVEMRGQDCMGVDEMQKAVRSPGYVMLKIWFATSQQPHVAND